MSNLNSNMTLFGIVLISVLWVGIPYGMPYTPYIDMAIAGPSTAEVGETFVIWGTSRMAAAELVELYLIDSPHPVGHAVVGIQPDFVYEIEVTVSPDGLIIGDEVVYSGPTEGKVFHFYVQQYSIKFNVSPILSVSIQ
jgi:hypothetical protein